MYLARFSYDISPVHRQEALNFIRREMEAARASGLGARILVPLTRPAGGPSLQFEVELKDLEDLEAFRRRGIGSRDETGAWMHAFSEILAAPPTTEIFRLAEPQNQQDGSQNG